MGEQKQNILFKGNSIDLHVELNSKLIKIMSFSVAYSDVLGV